MKTSAPTRRPTALRKGAPRGRGGGSDIFVLAGSAGFVASSFVPYYGGGVGPGFGTVSLYQQGSFGDSVGWYLGSLLFLFGGVATVALLAIAGVTRRGPRTAATMLAATVVAWSLTWTGLMIRDITFGLEVTLEWGFWVHAVSVGVVAIGTIVVVATARAGAHSEDVLRFVTETTEDAVKFDGDEVELAQRARNGDMTAVKELSRGYRAIAVLTALRLRPLWLPAPDAAQEAMLVLDRLVKDGSTTIAVDLPLAIRKTFSGLRPPDAR